jgi:hypothetical protein
MAETERQKSKFVSDDDDDDGMERGSDCFGFEHFIVKCLIIDFQLCRCKSCDDFEFECFKCFFLYFQ